jgi:hypothetical protein
MRVLTVTDSAKRVENMLSAADEITAGKESNLSALYPRGLPVRQRQRVVPVLFLPAANRQQMVEAKAGILLPEPQHRLQIVRRKSEVDDVLCEFRQPQRRIWFDLN